MLSAHKIVNQLVSIIEEIDLELAKNESTYMKLKNWQLKFYVSAIMPVHNRSNEFDIIFEATDKEEARSISCVWKDGHISEVSGH